jgi:drug/metabolite transporter (DMT)-like permease
MKNPTMNLSEWSLLILLSVVWGGSFFFNEIILRELQPFSLVLGRTALAAVVLITIVYATGRKMPWSLGVWVSFAVIGVFNNVLPYSLIVWGQQYIDSGFASILIATTPLFTIVFAHFLTSEEKLTLNRTMGVILSLAGVIVLIDPKAIFGAGLYGFAPIAVLGAACSYALAGIYGRRFREMDTIIPAAGMLVCSAGLMIPIVWLIDRPIKVDLELSTWLSLMGLAILSTAIAYLIYYRILRTAGATNVLLVTYLIPVSAILLGWFVLGEQLDWTMIAGMIIIYAGLILIDGRLLKNFGKIREQVTHLGIK